MITTIPIPIVTTTTTTTTTHHCPTKTLPFSKPPERGRFGRPIPFATIFHYETGFTTCDFISSNRMRLCTLAIASLMSLLNAMIRYLFMAWILLPIPHKTIRHRHRHRRHLYKSPATTLPYKMGYSPWSFVAIRIIYPLGR